MRTDHRSQSARTKAAGVHRDRPTVKESTAPRRCARCTETKPITEYRRDSRGYWRSWCNPCAAVANREWKAAHRAEYLEGKRRARQAAKASGSEWAR